jgi:hypothetical protein
LYVAYVRHVPGTARFQVEAAAFTFVAIGMLLKFVRGGPPGTPRRSWALGAAPLWTWVGFFAVALALYWPVLSIGLLSDDFVFVERASRWHLGPVSPVLFRPVPLLVWAILLRVGGGPVTLHLLNITLHATNACLTSRFVERWIPNRTWSICAGLLLLTAPLAPEAVAWCSGVFDLLATTLVLLSVIVARRYDDGPTLPTRVTFVALGIAAVGSKETAAIGAAIVLVDAIVRRKLSRELCVDSAALLGLVGLFGVLRLATAYGVSPRVSKYLLQRGIFGAFGALAVPWHIDLIETRPWLAILGVFLVVGLLMIFFVHGTSIRGGGLAVAAVACVLLPIVPVWPMFFVAPDLQGARYVYLSTVGWSALIVLLASEPRDRAYLKSLPYAAVSGLLVMSVFGAAMQLQPWREAARLRDGVEAAALARAVSTCRSISLETPPDSIRGAYVFRNGLREAFARDLQVNVTPGEAQDGCAFQWSAGRLLSRP